MNILYLGAFPPNFLIERSRGKIDSLYRAAEPLINGLNQRDDTILHVITSPDIASWPKGPLYVKREKNHHEHVTLVSSLNISFIKQIWTILSMTWEAGNIIRRNEGKVAVIIPYIVFRHVFSLRLLHFFFPKKVIQICVVPDIFFPRKWIYKMANRMTEKMASGFDGFLLYTKKMAEHLHVSSEKTIVIEGYREVPNRMPVKGNDFNVVYAGSLNLNYGLGRLVKAMNIITDPDIRLCLYGSGNAEKCIRDAACLDSRIHYFGRISNEETVNVIYSASVLINPRNANDGKYTEYSFPSKDIEYMATGIPTLLCKLPGMPQEYYGHFVDLGDGSPEEIANAIVRIKNMSDKDRQKIGEDSRDFIIKRMDSNLQADRIVEFLNRISKDE